MHLPKHSLLFGLIVFASLGLLSFTFPEKGISLGSGLHFEFPQFSLLFGHNSEKKDITAILKAIDDIDTSFTIVNDEAPDKEIKPDSKETKPSKIKTSSALVTGIQSRNGKALYDFFTALNELKEENTGLRVLHYGDSQIEGDRITDYLRLKLQGQFGGEGPGLVSLMPISQSLINRIENGPGWERYGTYTAKDKRVQHNNYGVLAGFCRFLPYKKLKDTSAILTSTLGITTTPLGGANALNFNRSNYFMEDLKQKPGANFTRGPL